MFNSVDNDWAYFPGNSGHSALLVTGREASFGGAEIWELAIDPEPEYPILLTTQWEVEGHMIPGRLIMSDAESGSKLAEVNVSDSLGEWDVIVAAGQAIRCEFISDTGHRIEGTYVLPFSTEPMVGTQTMKMKTEHGFAHLEPQSESFSFKPKANIQWSWDSMNSKVVRPTWVPNVEENDEPDDLEIKVDPVPTRIVQFVSYPWWTEEQKMERALAAHALSLHVNCEHIALPDAMGYNQWDAYEEQWKDIAEDLAEDAVEAILSKASAEVLLEESPWEVALANACQAAEKQWQNGILDLESLRRQVQQRWAHMNALFDRGLLPEVRDKNGLIQDGEWVLAPWRDGRIRALEEAEKQRRQALSKSGQIQWMLRHAKIDIENTHQALTDPSFWDIDSMKAVVQSEVVLLASGLHGATATELESHRRTASTCLDAIRLRMGMLDALEANEVSWSEEFIEFEIKQWMSLAFELSSALSTLPNHVNLRGNLDVESSDEDHIMARDEEGELALRWRMEWEEWVTGQGRELATQFGQTGRNSREQQECLAFIEKSTETIWQPSILATMIGDHWANMVAQSTESVNQEANSAPKEDSKTTSVTGYQPGQLIEELKVAAHPGMTVEEASVLLESMWMLSKWRHDPAWSKKSPEEIVPLLVEWHPIADHALQKWRVEWAREQQVLKQQSMKDADSGRDEDGLILRPSPPLAQDVAIHSGDVGQVEVPRIGETGMHLGWFLKQPQVPALPPRSRLIANQGNQGLTRWVLVLPEDLSNDEMGRVNQWFVDTGLLEAYEVHWDGAMWSRGTFNGSSEEVVLNTGSAENRDDSWIEGTKRQDNTWGGDELWEHGAPVLLKNLRGSWYAVQVGAFRGEPEKAWIEMAGERLVYEPFSDGIARWYAGVRQDESSVRKRWQELHVHQPFQDAFVVRLTNGEREVISMSESRQLSETTSEEYVPESVELTNSIREQDRESQSTSLANEKDDGKAMSRESEADLVEQIETSEVPKGSPHAEGTTWHVDIAKYYGTVPSSEVAVLLIRAADWGVRSVELFGQTTYFSRSYSNLQEARRVLQEVNQEGFIHAEIIQVN